jgi:phage terminase large subunit
LTATERLFPACTPGKCPIKGCTDTRDPHYHILPQQRELLESNEKFVALVGGYGSAKTLPSCIMGHILSVSIPGNMGIVMRRSLPKLHDSTERIYLEVLQRSGVEFQTREMRDGWPHRIIYPNGSEVVFRETTDIGRFLGPEYGWAFLDEAQEEPEKTFKDVSGRLRLPRAADYLKFILATNPPSSQHWIAKTFPKPGGWTREVRLNDGEIISLLSAHPFLHLREPICQPGICRPASPQPHPGRSQTDH